MQLSKSLLLIFVLFGINSCSSEKDYTCTCDGRHGLFTRSTSTVTATTEGEAESRCNDKGGAMVFNINGDSDTLFCSLD
jgi:hypothetical protein